MDGGGGSGLRAGARHPAPRRTRASSTTAARSGSRATPALPETHTLRTSSSSLDFSAFFSCVFFLREAKWAGHERESGVEHLLLHAAARLAAAAAPRRHRGPPSRRRLRVARIEQLTGEGHSC